ncbi:MAG: hypothetical protein MZU97_23000 [Bacillus subtilis]|nr:hypothetical protein [Bacillus subtilis]
MFWVKQKSRSAVNDQEEGLFETVKLIIDQLRHLDISAQNERFATSCFLKRSPFLYIKSKKNTKPIDRIRFTRFGDCRRCGD